MYNEIQAAVEFLSQLLEKKEKCSPGQIECFKRHLAEQLTERFKDHWFPEKPFKGQGYRCIRVNSHSRRDAVLESAANSAGLSYEKLCLPMELTLWIDPNEVCCRFGEIKGSYCTLASFDDKENTVPICEDGHEDASKENQQAVEFDNVQKSAIIISAEQHQPQKQQPQHQQQQQQPKQSKPLSTANQNQQHSNNGTGRRARNLNSPRLHLNRNRSWFGHSFNMGYGPHPSLSQPWYNIMPPHFLSGPSPPPFMGHRGTKWIHPPSHPAGPTRFHHWSPKAALKV